MRGGTYKGYVWAVFIGLDQLGNALTGGHPDVTVSARLGYLSQNTKWAQWKAMRKMVDWAFEPVDGPGHCLSAWLGLVEAGEGKKARRGNDVGLGLLFFGVAALALPLRIVNEIREVAR